MGSRTKDKECPVCGEMFSSQGLHGHLRMVHNVSADELRQMKAEGKEVIDLTERMDKTMALIDRLKQCRAKRREIEEEDKTGFLFQDQGAKDALEALDSLEKEIRQKIRDLTGEEEQLDLTGV